MSDSTHDATVSIFLNGARSQVSDREESVFAERCLRGVNRLRSVGPTQVAYIALVASVDQTDARNRILIQAACFTPPEE